MCGLQRRLAGDGDAAAVGADLIDLQLERVEHYLGGGRDDPHRHALFTGEGERAQIGREAYFVALRHHVRRKSVFGSLVGGERRALLVSHF